MRSSPSVRLTSKTLLGVLFALGMLAGLSGPLRAQGAVAGRVTDQATGNALSDARITVLGTSLTTRSNADGRYRIANVPAGNQRLRVTQIGYTSMTATAVVAAGVDATQDFALSFTPYSLEEVVVTATGQQAKREVGNAVTTVTVADVVPNEPIANMNDLLTARAPGVVVLPGSLTGSAARVRIRGNSSLSLSNNPIYIVDGVRVVSDVGSSSIGTGGTSPGRINDLNPEDIQSMDIVRGPSASTLYGTDAANGVVVITTKRGGGGARRPTWRAYAEQGRITDHNSYPVAYRAWRTGGTAATNSTPSNTVQCLLSQVITAACAQDSVTNYNVWQDPDASPLGVGNRNQVGLQVSGGEALRYFVSAEWEREAGVYHMPPVFRDRLLTGRSLSELPGEWDRPNALRKASFRTNLSTTLGEKADLAMQTGFITSTLRRPQTDNNALGIGSNAYGGPGFRDFMVSHNGVLVNNYGYRQSTPDEIFSMTNTQDINRAINSATANFRPTSWLATRAVVGLDFISRQDTELCRRDQCSPFFPTVFYGYKQHNRTTFFDYTGDGNATASYRLSGDATAKTIVGVQYIKENNTRNLAYAEDLVPGSTSISSGSIPSAGEGTATSITLGYFLEQQLAYKERLYLTGAVRSDRNSAFGKQFKRVYYPKIALSYVISDEPFFPQGSFISSLRLRGAYGASGRQPGGNDAIPYYTPTTTTVDAVDRPGLVLSALGNADLKPERTRELEIGFEAALLGNRVNTQFTYYNKNSRDALISRTLAPSAGGPASRLENIGSVQNRGIEAMIQAAIVDGSGFYWDVNLSGSYNKNKIIDMGGVPNRGTTTSDIEGYPIQSWWLRPFTYADTSGDGLIALGELTVGDTTVYVGPSMPVSELTGATSVEILNRKLRVQLAADAWLGGYQLNGTERIRCQNRLNCRGDVDPAAPLWEQARAMAVRVHSSNTQWGFVEKSNFLRLRELDITYTLPDRAARLVGASRLSLTASGRNLALFTNYSGADPQAGYFGSDIGVQSDFQTQPPPSYWTLRLNVTF